MAVKVKAIEATPNPDALKFVLSERISEASLDFSSAEQAASDPLAAALFEVAGVARVFWVGDFITITKLATSKWPALRRKATQLIEKSQ